VVTTEQKIESAVAIRNILFATDFSAVSEAALPYVLALGLRYGSTVHVAHVLADAVILRPGAPDAAVMGQIYEEAHSVAQEKMQQLARWLKGFSHKTYLRHGAVFDAVSAIIDEQEIDLLVLGTHGRTGLGKLIMGSVSEELFRQVPCPVLTVGPRVAATTKPFEARHHRDLRPPQIKFREILYATDLEPEAVHGACYATSLAREFQAHLTLLHVIDGYGKDLHEHPGPIDKTLHRLEELVPDHTGLRYEPEFVAQFGTPSELILQTAGEYEADLIVLGVRPAAGHVGTATHFAGSTAHKVVVGATCPVLTIRN
jgi:nucleotide-binding universal stress UspA family protein